MKLLNSFFNNGILPEHDVFQVRLIRAVNVLGGYAIVSMVFASLYGYYIQNNASSLYTLISLPFFLLVLYLNRIQKNLLAIAFLFVISALLLGVYSIHVGEESYLHSLYVLNIMGLSLLYRQQHAKMYFYVSISITLLCIIFVLLSFLNNWFEGFRDLTIDPFAQRKLNFALLIICSIVFSFVVVNSYKQQQHAMKLALEEQRVLLAEVNHRVKNNLAIIISLLNMQSNIADNKETKEALRDIHDRVMSMALVHQKMYKNKNKNTIELESYITDLIGEIRNSIDINKNIEFKIEIESIHLEVSTIIPLGLILNELITNAIKHAFKDKLTPNIFISLKEIENGNFELIVQDNGIGTTHEKLQEKNGLGVDLIQSLSEQIDGKCSFEMQNGLVFKLQAPIGKETNPIV